MGTYVLEVWGQQIGYIQRQLAQAIPGLVRELGLDDVLDAVYAVGRSTAASADDRTRYFYGVLRNKRQRGKGAA
jgi:hypothetical protein